MKVGSLFSGIGGFDLGLERAGMEIVWQSEIDPYASRVLKKHWPHVPNLGDIRTIDPATLPRVDLICGGFPCQPFSEAGKQRGKEDDRHLWPEMLRIIDGVRPAWIVGENVPGIIRMELDTVLSDLETLGYTTRTFIIPAAGVGAPHRRERIWIIAIRPDVDNPESVKERSRAGHAGPIKGRGEEPGGRFGEDWPSWPSEPELGRVAYGIPCGVDRLIGLGNAVVPQIVERIGRMILQSI